MLFKDGEETLTMSRLDKMNQSNWDSDRADRPATGYGAS